MKNNPSEFFSPADPEEVQKEKGKARLLRQSQWWKNQRGRNRCHYCQRPFAAKTLTMDHIVPLARGGKSTKSNVVPCCKECNTQKSYLLPMEWETYLQRLKNEDF